MKILQEENDELYEILKAGETGRLKEDVRSLRRVSQKLETALRGVYIHSQFALYLYSDYNFGMIEAHQVIESLS